VPGTSSAFSVPDAVCCGDRLHVLSAGVSYKAEYTSGQYGGPLGHTTAPSSEFFISRLGWGFGILYFVTVTGTVFAQAARWLGIPIPAAFLALYAALLICGMGFGIASAFINRRSVARMHELKDQTGETEAGC
jgi:hypothetical protein